MADQKYVGYVIGDPDTFDAGVWVPGYNNQKFWITRGDQFPSELKGQVVRYQPNMQIENHRVVSVIGENSASANHNHSQDD